MVVLLKNPYEYTIYGHKSADSLKKTLHEQLVGMSNWSYGLPSGTQLSDKALMIVYYAKNTNAVDIDYCKVRY